jgi:hypothetical protein
MLKKEALFPQFKIFLDIEIYKLLVTKHQNQSFSGKTKISEALKKIKIHANNVFRINKLNCNVLAFTTF